MKTKNERITGFFAADFETYNTEEDSFICLAGAYFSELVGDNYVSNDCFIWEVANWERWFKDLAAYGYNKTKNNLITVYFHNGSRFDADFILKYFVNEKDYFISNEPLTMYRLNKRKLLPKMLYKFQDDSGKLYELQISFLVGDKTIILKIVDSYLHISLPLAKLGAKGEIDYKQLRKYKDKDDVPKDVFKYFKTDCIILAKALQTYYRLFNKPKLTLGSTNLADIREKIGDKWEYFIKTELDTAIYTSNWIAGGWTFANQHKINKVYSNVYCYDANSFYPTQMQRPLIIGSTFDNKKPEGERYIDYVEAYTIFIKNARIKEDRGIYPLKNWYRHKDNKCAAETKLRTTKYVKELNNVIAFYFHNEWEELKEWYDIDFTILKTDYWLLAPYLKNVINNLYAYRKELKDRKDPLEKNVKLALNSVYGKLMEKPLKNKIIHIKKDVKIDVDKKTSEDYKFSTYAGKYNIIRKKSDSFNLDKYFAYVVNDIEKPETVTNPLIGSYITACARSTLMRIVRANIDNVLYGDTDSIYIIGKPKPVINWDNTPLIIDDTGKGNNLGEWKNEHPEYPDGFNFIMIGPKFYAAEINNENIKLKTAGANAKAIKQYLGWDKVVDLSKFSELVNKRIENAKTFIKRNRSGIKIDEKEYTIKPRRY